METAISQQNWAAGELSPKMYGRFELPIYGQGSERNVNFISETSGPARFRTGFQFVFGTRRYQPAWLFPFQFNDADAYELEFTTGYIRFYRNGGIVTLASQNITAAYNTNAVQLTVPNHGLTNGMEVIVNGVGGMTQLNNRSFVISNVTINTFLLNDNFGNTIDGTAYDVFTSGGTITPVYEVASPYQIADIPHLKLGQNADVVYIVHPNYEPLKLTRLAANSWTLLTFSRSGTDPCGSKITITGISLANPAQVTAPTHGYSTGQQIIINGVVGMTQINNSVNGKVYTISVIDANNFTLNGVDSTGYSAYQSGGYTLDKTQLVGAVAFYQGRLFYAYSDTYPESIWGSEPLDTNGNPQYDAFTLGTQPADAFKFTLSPVSAKVDKIESLVPTLNFLGLATFEGITAVNGGGGVQSGQPISPAAVYAAPVVTFGCLQQITPFLLGISMLYVHRSGLVLYSFEYDIFYNAFNAMDKNMTNDQWTESGLIQMVFQVNRPTAFWFARNDGVMIGLTYMVKENINGAHRHIMGGLNPSVLSVGVMPRTNAYDQLWAVTQRTIGSNVVRFVEYATDEVVIPQIDDFWTGNQAADLLTWQNAMFEAQKKFIYVDAALTYDGSSFGLAAGANLTPGATTGNGVTFTAGAPVFNASMVGQQLWKQSQNGVGMGRAVITAYVSSTQVTCNILTNFDNLNAMPAGQWYLTTSAVGGIWHLNGELATIQADGAPVSPQVVVNGIVNIGYQASVVHVGEGYRGWLRTTALNPQSQQGVTQAKKKTVNRLGIKFYGSVGASYGTSLYNMQQIPFGEPSDLVGRPIPLFSGVKVVPQEDSTSEDKHIYIQQTLPMPCNIQAIFPFVDSDDE